MGYEVKLMIGKSSQHQERGPTELDGDFAYRPWLKDEAGKPIPTGRMHTYFSVYAELDLCCVGNSAINEMDHTNKDPDHYWYWYHSDGNTEEHTDKYGSGLKPVSIRKVLEALKQDVEDQPEYRRFHWAVGLLQAMMDNDGDHLQVLIYGH